MSSSNYLTRPKPKKKSRDTDLFRKEKLLRLPKQFSFMLMPANPTWKPKLRTLLLLHHKKIFRADPRAIIRQVLGTSTRISQHLTDATLWDIATEILPNPSPRRQKLRYINTIDDVVHSLRVSKNIVVLTGAGISVSCGIPDFRSKGGWKDRIATEYSHLPNSQSMFDIDYFRSSPRTFYLFAQDILDHGARPSPTHRFIQMLEEKGKLLRNYTQNIDGLEEVAGLENVIQCHGSLKYATCTRCRLQTKFDLSRSDFLKREVFMCSNCEDERKESKAPLDKEKLSYNELYHLGIMKPNIVFFGESINAAFYNFLEDDLSKCDLLLVIGTSLRVLPVALVPYWTPPYVPQVLINREQLNHMECDVQLLGDADIITMQLCNLLGEDFIELSQDHMILQETTELKTKFDSLEYITEPVCDLNSYSPRLDVLESFDARNYIAPLAKTSFSLTNANAKKIDRKRSPSLVEESLMLDQELQTINQRSKIEAKQSQYVIQGSQAYTRALKWQSQPSTSKADPVLHSRASSTQNDDIADKLFLGTFYNNQNGIYVFPGAEVYFPLEQSNRTTMEQESDHNSSSFIFHNRSNTHTLRIVQERGSGQEFDAFEDSECFGYPSCDFQVEREKIFINLKDSLKKLYLDGI